MPVSVDVEVIFAALDPYAIFVRARAAMSSAHYPSELRYAITVSGKDGATARTDRYNARCDVGSGKIFIDAVSAQQAAAPHVPRGYNLFLTMQLSWNPGAGGQIEIAAVPAGRPEAPPDLLGLPVLSRRSRSIA